METTPQKEQEQISEEEIHAKLEQFQKKKEQVREKQFQFMELIK